MTQLHVKRTWLDTWHLTHLITLELWFTYLLDFEGIAARISETLIGICESWGSSMQRSSTLWSFDVAFREPRTSTKAISGRCEGGRVSADSYFIKALRQSCCHPDIFRLSIPILAHHDIGLGSCPCTSAEFNVRTNNLAKRTLG
jgi:hypothetical protein